MSSPTTKGFSRIKHDADEFSRVRDKDGYLIEDASNQARLTRNLQGGGGTQLPEDDIEIRHRHCRPGMVYPMPVQDTRHNG